MYHECSVKYGLPYATQARHNVLDVAYHVSQYQAIITELKDEISRLNTKLNDNECLEEDTSHKGSSKTKQMKKELINLFREQMNLRTKLMEIDNNVLALSMEFERQNQVVQEWESERLRGLKKREREYSLDMDDESLRG